jgi:hypothetical protein
MSKGWPSRPRGGGGPGCVQPSGRYLPPGSGSHRSARTAVDPAAGARPGGGLGRHRDAVATAPSQPAGLAAREPPPTAPWVSGMAAAGWGNRWKGRAKASRRWPGGRWRSRPLVAVAGGGAKPGTSLSEQGVERGRSRPGEGDDSDPAGRAPASCRGPPVDLNRLLGDLETRHGLSHGDGRVERGSVWRWDGRPCWGFSWSQPRRPWLLMA